MKQLVIRADDLGYCEAINYGIQKTVKDGLIRSVGLMPNMPASAHGVKLMRGLDVCLGQHTNLCMGKPCADPALIPSLLDENGSLHSSRTYREAYACGEEITVLEEMVIEVDAQYHRFVELTGRQPAYFEAHAIRNDNLSKALEIVAARYGLRYLAMQPSGSVSTFDGKPIYNLPMCSMRPGEYNPLQALQEGMENAHDDMPNVFICHPGYLDAYVLRSSSLTLNRTKEVDFACAPETKAWIDTHDIELITYDDIS